MPAAEPQSIRVRPVRGRLIDPYRGTPDADQQAERFAPRTAVAQSIDDVVAALHRLPKAKVARAGRRFTLTRGDESLKVAFASAARLVSLDDASWHGDPLLAIDALYALLPLFGAVELRTGGFVDLVDGHEPAEAVAGRFRTYWIDEALATAQKLADRPPPPPVTPVAPRVPSAAERRRAWLALGALGFAIAAIIGVWIYEAWWSKHAIGDACTASDQCRSRQCLPQEPVTSYAIGGVDMTTLGEHRPTRPDGVCTEACTRDADCPATMRCGDAISYEFHLGSRVKRCTPLAWDDATSPR